jgi:hypothetical protein
METWYDEGDLFWSIEATLAKNRGSASTADADRVRAMNQQEAEREPVDFLNMPA